ncbi:hypothetical protein R6867_20765, partial [Mycobacterium tuberculosis]
MTARSGPGSAVGAVCSRGAEQHTTAAAGTTTSDGYAEAAGPAVAVAVTVSILLTPGVGRVWNKKGVWHPKRGGGA